MLSLANFSHVHMIGIGGIGLSALARYFIGEGVYVTGSDGSSTKITDGLINSGVKISFGHNSANVTETVDLVIYTIAIPDSSPELVEARSRGLICLTYPEALGLLTKEYETIGVCGTHGKTTTTAMVAHALSVLGSSPTVVVGSLLAKEGTNYIKGEGKYLVVESCEYRRSFLNLHPTHVIVTNIDSDHLDYYKDMNDIQSAFDEFCSLPSVKGFVVTHENVSVKHKGALAQASESRVSSINLPVPGLHNRQNALLVVTLLEKLGFKAVDILEALKSFAGTWRRLEYKGKTARGALIFDDYGHHPREVAATVQALKEKYSNEGYRLAVFFQPHLYSRTKDHFDEFVQVLSGLDMICLAPIYAAREKEDASINSNMLVDSLRSKGQNARLVTSPSDLQKSIEGLDETWVILTIGAGDIYTWI